MRRAVEWVASPRVQTIANLILMAAFMVLIPVSLWTGLKESVPFLVFLSLWALVASHLASALTAAEEAKRDREQQD